MSLNWQQEQKNARRSIKDLKAMGFIPENWVYPAGMEDTYPVSITDYYLSLMDKGNPRCPIFLQAIPRPEEFEGEGLRDPIGDRRREKVQGLVHRYKNRILLLTNSICAVNCRFCFRKNRLHEENLGATVSKENQQRILDYLDLHPEVNEVVLSGGDPLSLSDRILAKLMESLQQSPNLRVIRFHTRALAALPSRITPEFLMMLGNSGFKIVIVHHFNHARELTPQVNRALEDLTRAGVMQFNQSVLLKGVNNSVKSLTMLMNDLILNNITPYYLHVTDRTRGAEHFMVELPEAQALHAALKKELSGYQTPRLILDLPEASGKVIVEEPAFQEEEGRFFYKNDEGELVGSERDESFDKLGVR